MRKWRRVSGGGDQHRRAAGRMLRRAYAPGRRGLAARASGSCQTATTRNARQTVEFAGLTAIPIAAGMPRPLVRQPQHAPEIHGESGLDGPTLPPPTTPIIALHAVDFIIEQSHAVNGLHLIPTGPLT